MQTYNQTTYIVGEQEDAIARYDRRPQEISTLPMLMPDREKRMVEITVEASYQIADPLQFRRTLLGLPVVNRKKNDLRPVSIP